jgi:hypothetical protein
MSLAAGSKLHGNDAFSNHHWGHRIHNKERLGSSSVVASASILTMPVVLKAQPLAKNGNVPDLEDPQPWAALRSGPTQAISDA